MGERVKRGIDGWRALLLYVRRLIVCLHAHMYGNVRHSVVKKIHAIVCVDGSAFFCCKILCMLLRN